MITLTRKQERTGEREMLFNIVVYFINSVVSKIIIIIIIIIIILVMNIVTN